MDTGIQLGRRFRALKLWMILRHFGAEGLRSALAEHMRLARTFAAWIDASDRFERVAPVPFSVVCFRLRDANGRCNTLGCWTRSTRPVKCSSRTPGSMAATCFASRSAISPPANRTSLRAWELLNSMAAEVR